MILSLLVAWSWFGMQQQASPTAVQGAACSLKKVFSKGSAFFPNLYRQFGDVSLLVDSQRSSWAIASVQIHLSTREGTHRAEQM